jgi:serine protease inhibitor
VHQEETMRYELSTSFSALELPYYGRGQSLFVFLPNPDLIKDKDPSAVNPIESAILER